MTGESKHSREELIELLSYVSHKTWMRQKVRDQGASPDDLDLEPTDHDRERAADTVSELERIGVLSFGTRAELRRSESR